jgi:hypothetical protein
MTRTSLALVLCLVACSKSKDADKAAPAHDDVAELPAAPAAPPAPWTYDSAAIQAKLQGAWVVKDQGYLGSIEAWEVKGDQVKMWDAKQNTEKTATLKLEAPCQFTVETKTKDGTEGTTTHFVFDGDTLHMGLGDAGVKVGDTIVACMSNGVFVHDAKGCAFYTSMFDKWEKKDATCAVAGDKFKATNAVFHFDGDIQIRGNVLADDQLWSNTPVKAASYDEAKTKAKP